MIKELVKNILIKFGLKQPAIVFVRSEFDHEGKTHFPHKFARNVHNIYNH